MSGLSDEQSLVQRAIAGDRFALEGLFLTHFSTLAGRIGTRLPQRLRAAVSVDDILQQTFVRAYQQIRHFEPRTQSSFLAWMSVIAMNCLRDAVKEATRRKRGGSLHRLPIQPGQQTDSIRSLLEQLADPGDSPSQSAARHEAIRAIHVALAGLPCDQRWAIRLHCLQGKSLDEVARQMGRTSNAVRGLVYRAKNNLRATLDRTSKWFTRI
jgi:RNA polymerase sigma-70 factor (ECF subfamily)